MDALVSHGLARFGDLEVVAADINPRVVSHLRRAHDAPPSLNLVSEIRDSETVTLSPEYRDYFAGLGRAIADRGRSAGARAPRQRPPAPHRSRRPGRRRARSTPRPWTS